MLCLSLLTPAKQGFKAKYAAFLLNSCQVRDSRNKAVHKIKFDISIVRGSCEVTEQNI